MFSKYLFLILIGVLLTAYSATVTAESLFLKKVIPVSNACSFEGHQNMMSIVKNSKISSEVFKILIQERKAGRCIQFKPTIIVKLIEVEFFTTITRVYKYQPEGIFNVHSCKFKYKDKILWTLWYTKIDEKAHLKMNNLQKREFTEKQIVFLDNLIDNGGNVTKAMEIAGYHKDSRSNLINSVKHEIVERTRQHLASSSVQAASRLIEGLDADGTIPSSQMEVRLRAANDILDRTGVSKRQEISTESRVLHGIVLLPAKKAQQEIWSDQS